MNESDTGYITRDKVDGPVTTVAVVETESFNLTKMYGVWWPESVHQSLMGFQCQVTGFSISRPR